MKYEGSDFQCKVKKCDAIEIQYLHRDYVGKLNKQFKTRSFTTAVVGFCMSFTTEWD